MSCINAYIEQDFRSSDGLYNLVEKRHPNCVVKGKDLFDISLFNSPSTTALFFTFMAELRASVLKAQSTITHKFIRTLRDRGKLIRNYTQNIDGLEAREGLNLLAMTTKDLRSNEVLQIHGDLHKLVCLLCGSLCDYSDESFQTLIKGEAVECPKCLECCKNPHLDNNL
jgi:NAD-dependent histone deacetylase SIR2